MFYNIEIAVYCPVYDHEAGRTINLGDGSYRKVRHFKSVNGKLTLVATEYTYSEAVAFLECYIQGEGIRVIPAPDCI